MTNANVASKVSPVVIDRDWVQNQLDTRKGDALVQFIGRALVVIFKNQTESERMANTVSVDNGVGFASMDGRSGGLTAKYFLKHKTLLSWQVDMWTKKGSRGFARLAKYHAQLAVAADQARQTAASVSVAVAAQVTTPSVSDMALRAKRSEAFKALLPGIDLPVKKGF